MEILNLKEQYNASYLLDNCPEIPEADKIRILYILEFLKNIEKKHDSILKLVRDQKYNESYQESIICSYLKYNPVFNMMTKDLFEKGDTQLVNKIALKQPFTTEEKYSPKQFTIPIEVLPKLSGFDTYSKQNVKSIAAGILGAKVV